MNRDRLPPLGLRRLAIGTAALALCSLAEPGRAAPRPEAAPQPDAQVEAEAAPPVTLSDKLDVVLAADFLADAKVGVTAVDLHTRKVLYRRDGDVPMNPASNVKLMTTGAALSLLGPEHRYPTRVYADRDALEGGVLRGNIYLRGSGDPSLVTADLYELAGNLRASGIEHIRGGVVVDSTRFDQDELPPGFDQKDEFAAYRAMSGATSVNFNTFVVQVRPALQTGSKANATLNPPVPSLTVSNEVDTVSGWRRRVRVAVETDERGRSVVTLTGEIGVDASPNEWRYPIEDPDRYAGEVFAMVLRQRGIRVNRRSIKIRPTPDDADLLGTHFSESLSILTRSVNKLSNNFMAEQVLKTLARGPNPATFAAAIERVRQWLDRIGVANANMVYGNGSGLYDTNRFSTDQITMLLRRMYRDFRVNADFVASLSIMGTDGTTRSRLDDTEADRFVRAKTGTLNEVSALSGYAGAIGRAPIAFSIVMNDLGRGEIGLAREVQNQVAELLAAHAADPFPLGNPSP